MFCVCVVVLFIGVLVDFSDQLKRVKEPLYLFFFCVLSVCDFESCDMAIRGHHIAVRLRLNKKLYSGFNFQPEHPSVYIILGKRCLFFLFIFFHFFLLIKKKLKQTNCGSPRVSGTRIIVQTLMLNLAVLAPVLPLS